MAATIYYHDIMAHGTVPAGASAANRASALSQGNLWCAALTGGSSFSRSLSDAAYYLTTTGTTAANTYLYPASNTTGTASYQAAAAGMFTAIRLRCKNAGLPFVFGLGTDVTHSGYGSLFCLAVFPNYWGTNDSILYPLGY